MKVQFEAGDGVNFMKSEDGRFYAEVKVPYDDIIDEYGDRISSFSEDYGYFSLKNAIIEIAKEHDVDPTYLVFQYDGQEQYLAEDAKADCNVYSEYLGD